MATATDTTEISRLLSKVEAGFLPFELFLQIARLAALSIYEVVPLKSTAGKVQILLLPRPADDPIWPNALHTPGTVIRPYDTSFDDAFRRVIDELGGTKLSQPTFVENILKKNERGTEAAQVYWAEVLEEPKAGSLYDAANLPAELMDSQREFIDKAVQNFREFKSA